MVLRGRLKKSDTPNGRKYTLALVSLLVVVGGFAIIATDPTAAMISLYENLLWGIFGVNSSYYGGNVANKWVVKKPLTQQPPSNTLGEDQNGNVRG